MKMTRKIIALVMVLASVLALCASALAEDAPITIAADPENPYAAMMLVKKSVKQNKVTVLEKDEVVNVIGTDAKKTYYWVSPLGDPESVYKVASKNLMSGKVTKISGLPKTLKLKVGEFKKLKWKINEPVFTSDIDLATSDEGVCTLNDALLESNEMIFHGVAPGTCTVTFTPLYGSAKVTMKVIVK